MLNCKPIEVALSKSYGKNTTVLITGRTKHTALIFQKADGKSYFRFSGEKGSYIYRTAKEEGAFVLRKTSVKLLLSSGKDYFKLGGKSIFLLSDTIWYGATKRISNEEFEKYIIKRKKQGFNAIQLVVGVPPEIPFFSEEAHNDNGHPFRKDFSVNESYFDALDKRIDKICEAELLPMLFLGWGHHIDLFGVRKFNDFANEVFARYGYYPAIFSLSGEVDVFYGEKTGRVKDIFKRILSTNENVYSLLKKFKKAPKKNLSQRIHKWKSALSNLRKINYNNSLLTAHVSGMVKADTYFGGMIDVNSIQSGHDVNRLQFMREAIESSKKIIINLEPWYEGIMGNFGAYHQRLAFWACALSGAKGHSYGAHGVWQIAKGDNFMGHWGNSSYKKALRFPGAFQLGISKAFLQKQKWEDLRPDLSLMRLNKQSGAIAASGKSTTIIYIPDANKAGTIRLKADITQMKWYNPVNLKHAATSHVSKEGFVTVPKVKQDVIGIAK